MKKRFFSFGCSLTNYSWATWADFIGVNFEESYNYGRGGASNTFIMQQLIEADSRFQLNADTDVVYVMLTGINRFSWFKNTVWQTNGDLHNCLDQPSGSNFVELINFDKYMWNQQWAIYQTWIAVKVIKNLLSAKGIEHKIILGIDIEHYAKEAKLFKLGPDSVKLINEILSTVDIRLPFESFFGPTHKHVTFKKENFVDGHPTPQIHFNFVEEYFPEYVTNNTRLALKLFQEDFDCDSIEQFKQTYEINRTQFPMLKGTPNSLNL